MGWQPNQRLRTGRTKGQSTRQATEELLSPSGQLLVEPGAIPLFPDLGARNQPRP